MPRRDDDDLDDELDDEPRPKRSKKRAKKSSGPPVALFVGLGLGLFVLLVGGGVAAVFLLKGPAVPNPVALPGVPGIPRPPAALTGGGQVIAAFNDAAEVLEGITSKEAFEAAKPRLQAVGGRMNQQRELTATGVYMAKMVPGMPREAQDQFAQIARTDPKFAPYRVEGEALAADPAFRQAYQRYNTALARASPHTGGILGATNVMGVGLMLK